MVRLWANLQNDFSGNGVPALLTQSQSFITTPSPTVVQIKQVLIGWVEEDESRGGSDPGFNGSARGEFVTGLN